MKNLKKVLSKYTGLLFVLSIISFTVNAQCQSGSVFSSENSTGIGFVNIGIIGKNVGTVSDESGNFTLSIDNNYDNDSLRFSMIGYEPKSLLVKSFKDNPDKKIILKPLLYNLSEVKVIYHRCKEIQLGNVVTSNQLRSGFSDNGLGSELGIRIETKGLVRLENINLNVATCTYDSVTYRLNIYKVSETNDHNSLYTNILTQPVYVSFSKEDIDKPVSVDLKKYSIIVEGDIIVSLELYKDLGEGQLLFHTEFFTGRTFHRKAIEAKWAEAPGVIGMYLNGQIIKSNSSHTKSIAFTD